VEHLRELLRLLLISEIVFNGKNILFLFSKKREMALQTAKLYIVQKVMNVSKESLLEKIQHLLDQVLNSPRNIYFLNNIKFKLWTLSARNNLLTF